MAVQGVLRVQRPLLGPEWQGHVWAQLIPSGVVGLTTAPIGAAPFNTMSSNGHLEKLLLVSDMEPVVIPTAAVSALLTLISREWFSHGKLISNLVQRPLAFGRFCEKLTL